MPWASTFPSSLQAPTRFQALGSATLNQPSLENRMRGASCLQVLLLLLLGEWGQGGRDYGC